MVARATAQSHPASPCLSVQDSLNLSPKSFAGQHSADRRDQYGDTGRDRALYSWRLCGLKLAQAVGLWNYGVVATNAKRYERRLEGDRTEKVRIKQVLALCKCETPKARWLAARL